MRPEAAASRMAARERLVGQARTRKTATWNGKEDQTAIPASAAPDTCFLRTRSCLREAAILSRKPGTAMASYGTASSQRQHSTNRSTPTSSNRGEATAGVLQIEALPVKVPACLPIAARVRRCGQQGCRMARGYRCRQTRATCRTLNVGSQVFKRCRSPQRTCRSRPRHACERATFHHQPVGPHPHHFLGAGGRQPHLYPSNSIRRRLYNFCRRAIEVSAALHTGNRHGISEAQTAVVRLRLAIRG